MNIQFVDTEAQDYHAHDWNLRVRKTEDDGIFELTYKKRYKVASGPFSTASDKISAALEVAKQDGFGPSTTFAAQVEVGYESQTLSLSRDVTVSDEGFDGIDLPLANDSARVLIDNAPSELGTLGTDHLANSIVYGPVLATRTKGDWNGFKLSIEVWLIRSSKTDPTLVPIVEASFKASDANEALEGQTKLVDFLQDKGWFQPEDSLRTKLVMQRYGNVDQKFV